MNNQLDIRRLGFLGRRYLINNWRSLAVAGGATAGVIFILVFLQGLTTGKVNMAYSSSTIIIMVIWGCINASMAFSALHDKNYNESYLLLPASALEKVLVKLLFSSLVLPLGILVLMSLTSVIAEGVSGLLFGTGFTPLNPLEGILYKAWGYLVIVQSLFFLGSAWFRKAHFIKTILALAIGGIALGFIGGIFFRIVFASYFDTFWAMNSVDIDIETLMLSNYQGLLNFLNMAARVLFYGVLAPFCWFTAWLRVKETQSSDGV